MKLKLFLGVCMSFLVLSLWAQDQRYWSDQKLQLADFAGSPNGSQRFQIKYDLVYSRKYQRVDKTIHSHFQVKAIFIPSQSWIVYDSLQAQRLRYLNVVFDFAELYARRFDDEINVSASFENSKAETIRALNDAVATVASDTKFGADEQRLAFWENHIDSVLRVTYRKEIPNHRYDRLTLGYYWGGAYNYMTGKLGDQFSSPASISNGIYLSWKRVMFAGHVTFNGKSKPSVGYYSAKQQFGDTARFLMNYSSVFVGYEIIKKPQFLLTPYVGLSTFRMMLIDNPGKKYYTDPLKGSINLGLGMDFRSQPFFQSNKVQLRYGLTVRASYSPYTYLPKLPGNCLSFMVGLSFYVDAIRNYL